MVLAMTRKKVQGQKVRTGITGKQHVTTRLPLPVMEAARAAAVKCGWGLTDVFEEAVLHWLADVHPELVPAEPADDSQLGG